MRILSQGVAHILKFQISKIFQKKNYEENKEVKSGISVKH